MKRRLIIFTLLLAGCSTSVEPPRDDSGRVQSLEPASSARFSEEPFRQVGLLIDTTATRLQYRVGDGVWLPVEITWSEDNHKVGRVLLDEPATRLELRANQPWSFGQIQFHDEIVAGDTLARDLPVAQHRSTPNGLAPADLVINRADWGARDPAKVCGSAHDPYRMAVHHTASPADDGGDAAARMRQMQAFHIDTNGWCDIGYHFVVSQAGQVYQGRSDELRTGAHALNQNSGNIGICLIGNFEVQQVNDTQFNKAAEIMGWVGRTYDIPFNRTAILGHREHDGQSTSCPGANLLSRLQEMVDLAAGGPPTPATPHPAAFEVNYLGELTDFYQAGSSSGKPDFFEGDTLQAELRFTNTTAAALRNVQIGYWFEAPHIAAQNYVIESDSPSHDQATFVVNDANDNPLNPPRDQLETGGTLGLYAMGAGETKRVLIDLVVGEYSIGLADHPDVRAWVKHVDDLYGEQSAFDEDPTLANAFEGLLQDFAELDVLSQREWQFDGGEPEQTEGWAGCEAVSPVVDVESGALVAQVGPADCLEAPPWTSIDSERWDQIVLRIAVEGEHDAALYWAADGDELSEARAVSFTLEGSGTFVVPVGEHDGWAGEITKLRVVPSLNGSTSASIDSIFVQSSSGESGSTRDGYVSDPPVAIGMDVAAPTPDPEDDLVAPALDDVDEFRVKKGCATASGTPTSVAWLLVFAAAIRRRRR